MVERQLCKLDVNGSIPLFSTNIEPPMLNLVGNHIEKVIVYAVATVIAI
jgi:hypothetical protein